MHATAARNLPASEWGYLFGHLKVDQLGTLELYFEEEDFPLGRVKDQEVEEHSFEHVISGREALKAFRQMKRKPAGLRAQGYYIKAHPNAQQKHPLVGIGARQNDYDDDESSGVRFPVFTCINGKPTVQLALLENKFRPHCRFLLQKA